MQIPRQILIDFDLWELEDFFLGLEGKRRENELETKVESRSRMLGYDRI